jgi:hypothetical protein
VVYTFPILIGNFLVSICSCGMERKPLIARYSFHKCWNVVRKMFQYFSQQRILDNKFLVGIVEMMNKLNIGLLCILIALRNSVRGIVIKVQDPTAELQPTTEMQLAGINFI